MRFRQSAEDQHWQVGRSRFDGIHRFDPALPTHGQVHQHDINATHAHKVKRAAPIGRFCDIKIPMVGEELSQTRRHDGVVVNHGNPNHDASLPPALSYFAYQDSHMHMLTRPLTTVKRNALTALMLFSASIAVLWITETSNQRAVALAEKLSAIAENRHHLDGLIKGVLDAESGQRGFLLTGREAFLTPYNVALKNIEIALVHMDTAYVHESHSSELLKKLHALIETKLSELAITVQMGKEGKRQAGRDLTLSGIGQEYMDAIRVTGAQLLDIETRRLDASQNEMTDMLQSSRLSVALLTVVSLLLMVLNMKRNQAFKTQQELHHRAMQAEQGRLQCEVARRTQELVELNNHLQTAREDERHRIARDLHDELGALLSTAKLDVARIKSRLGRTTPEASERLNHLVETLNAGIAMKRRIIEDLSPSTLSNLGLVATLEILGREFSESTGIPVHCTLQPVQLKPLAELVVYRLVQEATTNIAKYAQARNVWLSLETNDNGIEVTVRDDGIGFDTTQTGSKAYGLLGMRFRVEAEAGNLELTSTLGQGTVVCARLPQFHRAPE